MRPSILISLIGLLPIFAAGCVSQPADGQGTAEAGAQAVEAPATYAATLPCASCPGIAWTLTLLEDGTYRLLRVYLEAEDGKDRADVELGRWHAAGSNDQLTLQGAADGPIRIGVKDAETLHLLDQQGRPIDSAFDYRLRRLAELDRITVVFPMQGEFSYMADAGRFSECRTRVSLSVAQEVDNAALERAYVNAAEEPGGPVLVTFDGRFAMRPSKEGGGMQEVVIVEKFGEALPGARCEGAVDPAPLAALASVTSYAIDGEVLTLGEPGRPVARFLRYLE
jgi:copper homeostasis protein (lipoprotein)